MTPEQFCYCLQGKAELDPTPPTPEQWDSIRMAQHTQEPWHIFAGTVQSDTNWTICDARTKLKNADANARRIVACVNACAGIPTERLESCRVVLMTEIAKQRDALQDKIDDLLDSVEYMRDTFNRSAQHALDEARKIGG